MLLSLYKLLLDLFIFTRCSAPAASSVNSISPSPSVRMTEVEIADAEGEWFAKNLAEIVDGASPGKVSGTTKRVSYVGDASMRPAGGQATGGQDAPRVRNRFSDVGAPVSAPSSMVPAGGQSSGGQAPSNGGASPLTPEQRALLEVNKAAALATRKARLVRDAEVARLGAKADAAAVDKAPLVHR